MVKQDHFPYRLFEFLSTPMCLVHDASVVGHADEMQEGLMTGSLSLRLFPASNWTMNNMSGNP
ncbi:hypothetical protein KHA80_07085 [Anaerobacillus sp. HL2]|nr:hypothetical protein KHA80_07085 [Anaerobacillus sp. HL2]